MHVIRDVVLMVLMVFKALLLEVVALAVVVLAVAALVVAVALVVAAGQVNNDTRPVARYAPSCLEGDNRL
jgi:hypothetical protein